MRLRFAIGICLLSFFGASELRAESNVPFKRLAFESNGRNIDVDYYEPQTDGPHPTLLLLYGAGGLIFDGSRMRETAQWMVRAGYRVYLLHYFNQTKTFVAPPWTMKKDFLTWERTVRDAIAWVSSQPDSSAPIGIYGFSLGGFLALSAASDNPRVGAVVEQAGGLADPKNQQLGRMPPLLLVHGQRDKWVPYSEYVEPMVATLEKRRIKFETRFFPSEGHKFKPKPLAKVRSEAIVFFRRNLRSGDAFARQWDRARR